MRRRPAADARRTHCARAAPQAEAKRRDHRALGKQLNLFSIQPKAGGGLVFWHPKGATMRNLMEGYWKEAHLSGGYELLYTPHMASIDLWKTSGHFDFYKVMCMACSSMHPMHVCTCASG